MVSTSISTLPHTSSHSHSPTLTPLHCAVSVTPNGQNFNFDTEETITLQRNIKASTHVLVSLSADGSTRSLRVRLLISIEGKSIKNKEIKYRLRAFFLHFSRSLSVKTWKVNEMYDTVNIVSCSVWTRPSWLLLGGMRGLTPNEKKKQLLIFCSNLRKFSFLYFSGCFPSS